MQTILVDGTPLFGRRSHLLSSRLRALKQLIWQWLTGGSISVPQSELGGNNRPWSQQNNWCAQTVHRCFQLCGQNGTSVSIKIYTICYGQIKINYTSITTGQVLMLIVRECCSNLVYISNWNHFQSLAKSFWHLWSGPRWIILCVKKCWD